MKCCIPRHTKHGRAAGGLLGLMMAGLAAMAAIAAFIVVVAAALGAVAVVAAALVAYLKRETWTRPAYEWTRDRAGRWRVTPWSAGEPEQSQEEAPAPAEPSETTP
jgi:hypothetical protein